MLKKLFLGALCLVSFFIGGCQKAEDDGATYRIPREKRSVLLITVDTTRADHLQPYGAQNIATPTFLQLAKDGIVMNHAYSVAPITLVAHTSILTGLYPPQHGVRNNGTHYVPEELETLAERLQEEGYRTSAFVSAAVLEKRYGLGQGFEVYDDDLSAGVNRHPRMVPDRPAEATVDVALEWLDSLDDKDNFFSWIHFYDPHAAYSPPAPYRDRYRERLYDGEIAYMDAQIGRLLEHPRLSKEQDLIVVVLGDHGESLGEHGEQTHAILAYDSTLRVPWIMRISGGPQGVMVQEPVGHVDLFPTVVDTLGLKRNEELPGGSLLDLFAGSVSDFRKPIYSETYLPYYTYGWAKLKVLRQGFIKYVAAPTPELFDLKRDPSELSNQIEHNEGTAHDMARNLDEFLSQVEDPELETSLALDSEAADKLRSLGYLSAGTVPPRDGARPDPKEKVHLHVGLERARRMSQDRLFPQATRQLRQVLQQDPHNLAAMVDLAAALDQQGEVEEGMRVVERALALDPRNPRLYIQMANFEARQGDREKALAVVDSALDIDPRYLEARVQKATYLFQLKRFEELETLLGEALEEDPQQPRLNALFARFVETRKGQLQAAEDRLRQSLERDPFLVMGYRFLGDVLQRTNQQEEAIVIYREGLQRTPDEVELHGRLGLLLAENGGGAETERHLNEAIRLARNFRPDLHAARGAWLAEQGRMAEAQQEYARVLEEEPKHPGARNNRAIAYYQTGREEEAIRELNSVLEDFPKHADSYNNLAAIAIHRRDWQEVESHARAALKVAPEMTEAWNNLGVGLEEQGQVVEAEKSYRKALELAEGYWQARFNLGVLLRKSGQPKKAAEALEKTLEWVPSLPGVHLELGDLYAGPLADHDRARLHWNAVLRTTPNHPQAPELRRRLAQLSAQQPAEPSP